MNGPDLDVCFHPQMQCLIYTSPPHTLHLLTSSISENGDAGGSHSTARGFTAGVEDTVLVEAGVGARLLFLLLLPAGLLCVLRAASGLAAAACGDLLGVRLVFFLAGGGRAAALLVVVLRARLFVGALSCSASASAARPSAPSCAALSLSISSICSLRFRSADERRATGGGEVERGDREGVSEGVLDSARGGEAILSLKASRPVGEAEGSPAAVVCGRGVGKVCV